jgi:hypothetical protein
MAGFSNFRVLVIQSAFESIHTSRLRVAILFSECIGDYHAQVSGFRDQGTEIWARENTN